MRVNIKSIGVSKANAFQRNSIKPIEFKNLFQTDNKLNKKLWQYLKKINIQLPKSQHIHYNELYEILYAFTQKEGEISEGYVKKRPNTNERTSICCRGEAGNYVLLLKPAIKNQCIMTNNDVSYLPKGLCKGSNKFIKTTGVKIVFNERKELIDIRRVVTCSKNNLGHKDEALEKNNGDELMNEGYKKVTFSINNKNRIIYVNDYLGKNLYDLQNSLKNNEILLILKMLQASVDHVIELKFNDIKLNNILYDNKNKVLNFIDYSEKIFTFTTEKSTLRGLYKDIPDDSEAILKQRILGLTNLFYQLLNKQSDAYIPLCFNEDKKNIVKNEINENDFLIDDLIKAYKESLDVDKLKNSVAKAINLFKEINLSK